MMAGLQCEEKGWKQVPNCSVKGKRMTGSERVKRKRKGSKWMI